MSDEKPDLQSVLDKFPGYVRLTYARMDVDESQPADEEGDKPLKKVVAVFSFSEPGFGFGEITMVAGPDGQTYLDTECMSLGTVKKFFSRLLDTALVDGEKDPERRHQYDQFMRGQCPSFCPICYPKP